MKTTRLRYAIIILLVLITVYTFYLAYHFLQVNVNGSTFLHLISLVVLDIFQCIEIYFLIRGIRLKNHELGIHPIAYEGEEINMPPFIVSIIGLVLFLVGFTLTTIFGYINFDTKNGCNLLVVSIICLFGLINVVSYFSYLLIVYLEKKDIYKIIK